MKPQTKSILKQISLYSVFVLGLCLVLGTKGCDPAPSPTVQHTLPAEPAEQRVKIWTEADFNAAEVPFDTVSYLNPCDNLTGDCGIVTEADLALIKAHHQQQLQRLTAGARQ